MKSHEMIRAKIKKMVAKGHDPKEAMVMALSHARKMAKGGMVDDEASELNRSINEINADGVDYDEAISNPEDQKEHMKFADMLHKFANDEMDSEGFAMGGLVEGESDGEMGAKPSEDMKSETEEPKMVMDEATMKALMEKKKKRKFM